MTTNRQRHLGALHAVYEIAGVLQTRINELQHARDETEAHLRSVLGSSPAPDALDSLGQLAAAGEGLGSAFSHVNGALDALAAHMRNI